MLDAGLGEELESMIEAGQGQGAAAQEQLLGVAAEGDHRGRGVDAAGACNVRRQDRPVPPVDAVEDADGHHRASAVSPLCRQSRKSTGYLHRVA